MTKDSQKVAESTFTAKSSSDVKLNTTTLDPSIQSAIHEAVQASMKAILTQMAPPKAPLPAGSIPPPEPTNIRPNKDAPYVSRLKGIPVAEGQDLRHVPAHQVREWFNNLESRWKESYNKRKVGDGAASMSWTRG